MRNQSSVFTLITGTNSGIGLELARQATPNDAEVWDAIAAVYRRRGRWEDAVAHFERARQLDPRNAAVIWNLGEIIEHITRSITLEPGDVIATGTPAGVGYARKPPVFLRAGDVMTVDIEGVGSLGTPIEA